MCSKIEPQLFLSDIVHCKRIGSLINDSSYFKTRKIHMTLKYRNDASLFHNFGVGRQVEVGSSVWINPGYLFVFIFLQHCVIALHWLPKKLYILLHMLPYLFLIVLLFFCFSRYSMVEVYVQVPEINFSILVLILTIILIAFFCFLFFFFEKYCC